MYEHCDFRPIPCTKREHIAWRRIYHSARTLAESVWVKRRVIGRHPLTQNGRHDRRAHISTRTELAAWTLELARRLGLAKKVVAHV